MALKKPGKRLVELEIREGIDTIQAKIMLKSAWILRRIRVNWENFFHPEFSKNLPVKTDVKNPQGVK